MINKALQFFPASGYSILLLTALTILVGAADPLLQDDTKKISIIKGKSLYANNLSSAELLADWKMEGPGESTFEDGWMTLYSEGEAGHHVFWCPMDFPKNFVAEWEVQNKNPAAGLCIVFFSAKGIHGEDIFDESLKERDGTFKQYTKGDINNYHISYHANTPLQSDRPFSHLRKNRGFHKVLEGKPGIPAESEETHRMQLVRSGDRILMFLDGNVIVDWTDNGKDYGPVLADGKFGLRQMKWTKFRYRNLQFWELEELVDIQ